MLLCEFCTTFAHAQALNMSIIILAYSSHVWKVATKPDTIFYYKKVKGKYFRNISIFELLTTAIC